MSIRTLYQYDGITHYQAVDFMMPWDSMLTDGVFGIGDFPVLPDSPADLGVTVWPGRLKKSISGSGYMVSSDAQVKIPITANTSGYNRIDLIVVEIDTTNNVTAIKAVQGIPSSAPAAPTATVNQFALAQVLVGNNASAIDANVITDRRVILGLKIEPKQSVYDMSANLLNGWTSADGVGPWIIVTGKIGNIVGKVKAPSLTIINSNMKIFDLPDGVTLADTSEGLYVNGAEAHPLQLTQDGLVAYSGTLQAPAGGISMTFAIKDAINQRAIP